MVRKYEQQIRAETAEETRRRVLGAVAQRLRDAPAEPLSLDEVAKLARVARSTIYLIFGSRAGLFEAFTEDLLARTGLADLTKAVAHEDPRRHMRDGIAAACTDVRPRSAGVSRAVLHEPRRSCVGWGSRRADGEASERRGMAYLARRLAEDSVLRDDVTVAEAGDVLWVLCSFETFDALYGGRDRSLDETVEVIAATAERSLCRACLRPK